MGFQLGRDGWVWFASHDSDDRTKDRSSKSNLYWVLYGNNTDVLRAPLVAGHLLWWKVTQICCSGSLYLPKWKVIQWLSVWNWSPKKPWHLGDERSCVGRRQKDYLQVSWAKCLHERHGHLWSALTYQSQRVVCIDRSRGTILRVCSRLSLRWAWDSSYWRWSPRVNRSPDTLYRWSRWQPLFPRKCSQNCPRNRTCCPECVNDQRWYSSLLRDINRWEVCWLNSVVDRVTKLLLIMIDEITWFDIQINLT